MNEMGKSILEAFACGEDGLKWVCELYYENFNSSIGMKKAIIDLNDLNPNLALYNAKESWKYQHKEKALEIYKAMTDFGIREWVEEYLKVWLGNGKTKEDIGKILLNQPYYGFIERELERL